MKCWRTVLLVIMAAVSAFAADLTGNWVAENPLPDGTVRKTYFDLKQEESHITGHLRVTQFYYTISDSNITPEGFAGLREQCRTAIPRATLSMRESWLVTSVERALRKLLQS
jgi:hypothetical protein